MSWRTVVVTEKCKLSYKNNYMIIRNEEVKMVHLSEMNLLVIDTTLVSITSILLCELLNRKIKIIFCDERHNPKGEVTSYYGSHNTSKKVQNQSKWTNDIKSKVWKKIIEQKIINQAKVLELYEKENVDKLKKYAKEVDIDDNTNREGFSAKVYFNSLFGSDFSRSLDDDINAALNYGYSILLSTVNKEVVSNGYITQLGVNHKNEFNQFNLGCDLMEPFRPFIDCIVFKNKRDLLDKEFKYKLINVLNEKALIDGKEYYLSNAIQIYTRSILKAIEYNNVTKIAKVEIV
ncbi:type II CRISPR-associated endonuclease Cas1 [Clostridium chrysemydis]|uniref:type II CRISPR-associated endonuclease Cas1 n=1 Tax=Clostridium chrysemydis TaxID=2665504 RepID=UPI003F3B4134